MKNRYLFLILILLTHLFLLLNFRFEAWPEMILYPWLMSKGFLLYQEIINPYLPFLSGGLFFFLKLAGFSLFNLKLFTWGIIILIDLLVFYLALKFWRSRKAAFYSLIFFVFWQIYLDGNGLWFDLAVTPFLLLAFYCFWQFLKQNSRKTLLLSGLFLAITVFIKQTASYLYLPSFYFLIRQKDEGFLKRFFKFWLLILPLFSLLLLSLLYFHRQGILPDFVFWGLDFPFLILPGMPGHQQLPNWRQLFLSLIPFLFLIFLPMINFKKEKNQVLLLGLWLFFTSFFILPRWGLFHLQPALAFSSLLFGKIAFSLMKGKSLIRGKAILIGLFFASLFFQAWFLQNYWREETRFFEKTIMTQAEWLRQHTDSKDRIFNLNGPDQLYFLADRLPIKPWVANFSWYYEGSNLKTVVLSSLEENPPEWVIYRKPIEGEEYSPGVYQPTKIHDWLFENYQSCFRIEEVEFLKKKNES